VCLVRSGHEQASRLRLLLEQLLDLSRVDSTAITADPRPIVVHTVVSDIVDATLGTPDRDSVLVEIAADLAAVADRQLIERVLSNLLVNASKYGRPPIVVTAEQSDSHLRIAVEDAGPGIARELEQRLFEPFERGQDAQGAGLGLSIARAYARAHGGELIFAPRDKGARFELVLPRA